MERSTGLLGPLVWRMTVIAAWLILALALIALARSAYLSPLKTFVAVAVAVLLLITVMGLFALIDRHAKRRCLSCGGSRLDFLSWGFWDSFESGQGGGRFTYAVCKDCGTRRVEYEPRKPHIPTEEEWQSHFAPIEKRQRELEHEAEQWPFHSEN